MNPRPKPNPSEWRPIAAVCGWLVPGLGHIVIGEKKRGLIIMAAILGLFVAGLLIGGVEVINSHVIQPGPGHDGKWNLWFFAQVMVSPAVFVLEVVRDLLVNENKLTPAIGRIHEIGTLYCAMAGMLNLLVVIDVVYRGSTRKAEPAEPTESALQGRIVTRENAS